MPTRFDYAVTAQQKEAMSTVCTDLECTSALPRHTHPILKFSRGFFEREMCKYLSDHGVKSVVDVGGNPKRAASVASKVIVGAGKGKGPLAYWSCNPVLDADDAIRQQRRELQGVDKYCNHTVQEHLGSTCSLAFPDALMFVHSMYYLTPLDIAKAILKTGKKLAVASVHHFDSFEGTLPPHEYRCTDEAEYYLEGEQVVMQVYGNTNPYRHSAMHWLAGPGLYLPELAVTLCWTQIMSGLGTKCYHLTVHNGDLGGACRSALTCPRVGTLISDQEVCGLRSKLVEMTVHGTVRQVDRIRVVTAGLLFTCGTESIVLPNELIQEGRVHCAGKQRDEKLWQSLYAHLRSRVGKLRMSPTYAAQTLPAVCAFAFVEGIEAEMVALAQVHKYKEAMEGHKSMTAFQTWVMRKEGLSGWIEWAWEQHVRRPTARFLESKPYLMTLYVLCALPFMCLGFAYLPVSVGGVVIAVLMGCLADASAHATRDRAITNVGAAPSKAVTTLTEADLNPKIGTVRRVPVETPKEVAGPSSVVQFGTFVPLTPSNCETNLLAAASRRLGSGSEVSPGWETILAWSCSEDSAEFHRLIGASKGPVQDPGFEYWIENCNRSEDKIRVEALRKAKQNAQDDPTTIHLQDRPHVKDEACLKPNFKPRAIFATNDEYLVELAPWTFAAGLRVKEAMAGEESGDEAAFYASGCTAVELGAQHSFFKNWSAYMLEVDFGSYEGTICEPAIRAEINSYKRLGAPPEVLELFEQQLEPIKCGVYTRSACRRSAVPNTSLGNTLSLYKLFFYYFTVVLGLPWKSAMRLIILGDDSVIYLSEAAWRKMGRSLEHLQGWLVDTVKMKPEMKVHVTGIDDEHVEFCSGWFLPATKNGEPTNVWTPKVGRVLAKTMRVKASHKSGRQIIKGIASQFNTPRICPALRTFMAEMHASIQGPETPTEWSEYQINQRLKDGKNPSVDVVLDHPEAAFERRYGLDYAETAKRLKQDAGGKWPIQLDPEFYKAIWDKDVAQDIDCVDEVNIEDDQVHPNLTIGDQLGYMLPAKHQGPGV